MTTRYLPVIVAALACAVTLGDGIVSTAWSASPGIAKSLDPDNDGTMDLNEAKAIAARVFALLDRDKDGTLDRREQRARVNGRELAASDPDRDGTLDKNEYIALVERRFNAADPDKDGTIDARELRSRAGLALLRLLK